MKYSDENKRLTQLWYSFKRRGKNLRKFQKEEFIDWYNTKVHSGCYYCGITEKDCRELVLKLPSSRFPKSPKLQPGKSRGYYLEVDRKEPKGDYSTDNCVLSCYFCNNDKSDVFNHDQYMELLHGDNWETMTNEVKKDNRRNQYLMKLLELLSK